MGKIRVKTLGDEEFEKEEALKAKARREGKKAQKEHVKGVGLKGGERVKVVEGVELKPEIEAILKEGEARDQGEEVPSDGEKKKKAKFVKAHVHSKRYQDLAKMVKQYKLYTLKEAIDLIKKTSQTKFVGTVEAHININPAVLAKEKTSMSGTVNLPHGTGKKRVIRIADDEVIKQVTEGKIDFDVLVAHPSMMSKLAKVARILGPKGLMPNPKNGTVTPKPEERAKELEGGELSWKTEPDHPVIHQALGKVSFTNEQLTENIKAFVKSVGANKIAKFSLNATMGPGIKVDLPTVSQ